MKTKYIFTIFLGILVTLNVQHLQAQCTVSSSCGYNIDIFIKPLAVVPTTTNCPYGYNYDITFAYTITTTGSNTCYNDNIGFQPLINCNGQNSSYYTINVAAPIVGAPPVNASVTGTLTTGTNQYTPATDCDTVTPASLNCNSLQVTIYGPGISSNTYPCSFSTLPIQLKEFTSLFENGQVLLKWTTVTEKNNAYFFVERSNDGQIWTPINKIDGAGTSFQPISYKIRDNAFVEGLNYYRLVQVDNDGSFKYSPITVVNTSKTVSTIRYFPNPFTSIFSIETNSDVLNEVSITNNLNSIVFNGSFRKLATIDLSTQPAGIYFMKIKNGTGEEYIKLIKN